MQAIVIIKKILAKKKAAKEQFVEEQTTLVDENTEVQASEEIKE
jgi:hypothetical protein